MNLYYLFRNKLDHLLYWYALRQFAPVDHLVDIGCDGRPQTFVEVKKMHYLVDPTIVIENYGDSMIYPRYFPIKGEWKDVLKGFPDNYIDMVVLMDVVEHVEIHEAKRLLKETERISKEIVVFTPFGFMEQVDTENPWNSHISGWYPDDFGKGWSVTVFPYFHWCDFKGKTLEKPHGAMLAIYRSDVNNK